jgi:hypothetical protein
MSDASKTPLLETRAIEDMLRELNSLVQQRDKIQARISKVEAVVRALIDLVEDEGERGTWNYCLAIVSRPSGLTEVIKRIMRREGRLSGPEVRDRLIESGFPLSDYSNPLAVVHTTLSRLQDQGLIRKREEGVYEWAEPKDRARAKHLESMTEAMLKVKTS